LYNLILSLQAVAIFAQLVQVLQQILEHAAREDGLRRLAEAVDLKQKQALILVGYLSIVVGCTPGCDEYPINIPGYS
jgi:hypothetical protein